MTAFAELPLLQWKSTRAGRVRAVLSATEDMYLIYSEDGRYIAAIHEDCLDTLLEIVPDVPAVPVVEAADDTPSA